MAWDIPITIGEDEYSVRFDGESEPSQEDISEAVASIQSRRSQPLATEQTLGSSMLSEAGRGVLSVPKGIVGGVGALASIVPGMDNNFLQRGAEGMEEWYKEKLPVNPLHESNFPVQATGALGQAAGQLGLFFGSGGLGATPEIASAIGLGSAGLMGAESGEKMAEQYGITDPLKRAAAILGYAGAEAGTESMFALGTSKFSKSLMGRMASAMNPEGAALRFGKTMGGEAIEEPIAGWSEDILAKGLVEEDPNRPGFATNGQPMPPDLLSMESLQNRLREGALGGIGGALFGGVDLVMSHTPTQKGLALRMEARDAMKRLQDKTDRTPEEEAELEQLQAQDETLGRWIERQGIDRIRPAVDKISQDPREFAEGAAKAAEDRGDAARAAFWRSPEGEAQAKDWADQYSALSDNLAMVEANPEATPEEKVAARNAVDDHPLHSINSLNFANQNSALEGSWNERQEKLRKDVEKAAATQTPKEQVQATIAPVVEDTVSQVEQVAPEVAEDLKKVFPQTQTQQENAVQEKQLIPTQAGVSASYEKGKPNFLQEGARLDRGGEGQAQGYDPEENRRGQMEASWNWLQAFVGDDSEASANASEELSRLKEQSEVSGKGILDDNDAAREDVRAPLGDAAISGERVGEMGARSPQEQRRAGQSAGESGATIGVGSQQGALQTPKSGAKTESNRKNQESRMPPSRGMVEAMGFVRSLQDKEASLSSARSLLGLLRKATPQEREEILTLIGNTIYALRQQSAKTILPRQQGQTGSERSVDLGVGQVEQGAEAAREGEAQKEEVNALPQQPPSPQAAQQPTPPVAQVPQAGVEAVPKTPRRKILKLKVGQGDVQRANKKFTQLGGKVRIASAEEMANDAAFKARWMSLNQGATEEDWNTFVSDFLSVAEGINDDGSGNPVVIPENITVYDTDVKRAKELGLASGQEAAALRVMLHENWHVVENWLANDPEAKALKQRYDQILNRITAEEMDDLASRRYGEFSNWRENGRSKRLLQSEVLAERREKARISGEPDSLVEQFMAWLRDVWLKITNSKTDPTEEEMEQLFQAWKKAQSVQTQTFTQAPEGTPSSREVISKAAQVARGEVKPEVSKAVEKVIPTQPTNEQVPEVRQERPEAAPAATIDSIVERLDASAQVPGITVKALSEEVKALAGTRLKELADALGAKPTIFDIATQLVAPYQASTQKRAEAPRRPNDGRGLPDANETRKLTTKEKLEKRRGEGEEEAPEGMRPEDFQASKPELPPLPSQETLDSAPHDWLYENSDKAKVEQQAWEDFARGWYSFNPDGTVDDLTKAYLAERDYQLSMAEMDAKKKPVSFEVQDVDREDERRQAGEDFLKGGVQFSAGEVTPEQDRAYLAAVERGDMETAQRMVDAKLAEVGAYWHGTPSGDLRGGTTGLHVGTRQAAMEALEARIGIPADGKGWDGTREYGKTLLAGRDRVESGQFGKYRGTGYNADSPKEDFYAKDHRFPTVSGGVPVDPGWKPWIRPVLITGPMAKRTKTDNAANLSMARLLKKGEAKEGFFYKNIGEDVGSISAVLPSGDHVRVKLADPVTYDAQGNVIPLSQRFNPQSSDIRFSKPEQEARNRLAEIADFFSTPVSPTQEEGMEPVKATEDKRTFKSTGEPVEFYKKRLSVADRYGMAGEAIKAVISLSPDGPSHKAGKSILNYIRGGLLPNFPFNADAATQMANWLEQNIQVMSQLGLDPEDVQEARQQIGTESGRALQGFKEIYDPMEKTREEVAKVNGKAQKEAGVKPREMSDSVKDDIKQGVAEASKDIDKNVRLNVVEAAQNEADEYPLAMKFIGPENASKVRQLEDELAELEELLALEKRMTSGGDVAASRPELPKNLTLDQVRSMIQQKKKNIERLLKEIKLAPEKGEDAVEKARKTVKKAKRVKAESEEVHDNASFHDWVVNDVESADIGKFSDVMQEYIDGNGFNVDAFTRALLNKFKEADPNVIAGVANRIGALLNGNADEEGIEADQKKVPNFDARAKRIIAKSLGNKVPEKTVNPLNELIKKRLNGEITAQQFQDGVKKLDVTEDTAYALSQKVDEDIANRKTKKEKEVYARIRKNVEKARERAINRAVKNMGFEFDKDGNMVKSDKKKKNDPKKVSRFARLLMDAVNSGVLNSQTVSDAFAQAWGLHGLTEERLTSLGEILQKINLLPEGMVKETFMNRFNSLLNEVAPTASFVSFAHEALMGYILGGLNTNLMQLTGVFRFLNPFGNATELTLGIPGTAGEKLGRATANFLPVYLQGLKELVQNLPQFMAGISGMFDSNPYGVGAIRADMSAVKPRHMSMSWTPYGQISKARFEAPKLIKMMGLEPLFKLTRYPTWMASRSFQLIRGFEGLVASADKNIQWRVQMAGALMQKDPKLTFRQAWKKVDKAMGDQTSQMRKDAQKEAKEDVKEERISPFSEKQRVTELMQDKLERQWDASLENRHREVAALLNYKTDPITPLGSFVYQGLSKFLQREDGAFKYARFSFLFARFFTNAIESAWSRTPMGGITALMMPKGKTEHLSEREKRVVEIFGSLDNYRDARIARSISGTATMGLIAGVMIAALKGWNPDDDEAPWFWVTGDPMGEFGKKGIMESTGWYKPQTLYLGPFRFNYVNASPELAMAISAVGNIADRFIFDRLLNYKYNPETGEHEHSTFQKWGRPVLESMAAPVSRSTFRSFYDAIESAFNGDFKKMTKLLSNPITGTATALSPAGMVPSLKSFEKIERGLYDPKSPRSWDQAVMSSIPFGNTIGADLGKPLVTPFGEPLSPYPFFSMLSTDQPVSPERAKAGRLLAELGVTHMGPEVNYKGWGLSEIAHDGERYLVDDSERRQILDNTGKRFAAELNRNAAALKSLIKEKEGDKKVRSKVTEMAKKARAEALYNFTPKGK